MGKIFLYISYLTALVGVLALCFGEAYLVFFVALVVFLISSLGAFVCGERKGLARLFAALAEIL